MKEINDDKESTDLFDDSVKSNEETPFNESLHDSIILGSKDSKDSFFHKLKIKFSSIPFIYYFFILIFLSSLSLMIYYFYFYETEIPNFIEFDRDWLMPEANDRKYKNFLFNNGLEVMLLQDVEFDRDGGAVVIENGYLDNPLEEGLSIFISYLLSYLSFEDAYYIDNLQNYFGSFKFNTEEHFTNFRFDILNNGFKRFLPEFSSILNLDDKNFDNFEEVKKDIINQMKNDYEENKNYIEYRENHLIEYLVYGFKNEKNEEILPEGNYEKLNKTLSNKNISQIKYYIDKLINPKKIKIVIFSKYKFSISSNYMKHYFKYLTNKKYSEENNKENNDKEIKEFNKSQIIYIKAEEHESNYLKIIYYIDKVNNEDFPELFYKKNFLLYLSDFIAKKKNGSLYYKIRDKIKSIETFGDVVLKSKIKFEIKIELADLNNINDIIYSIYLYMHQIIKEITDEYIQMDRYKELWEICSNDQNLAEKSYVTIDLAYNNAKQLFQAKYNEKYFFYYFCLPWSDKIKNNISRLYDEIPPYLSQLRPNNSIIILAIKDKDKQSLTCNTSSKFELDCDYLMNEENIKYTKYYDIEYMDDIFNSTKLEENLDEDEYYFDITFENNEFKSIYNTKCTYSQSDKENFTKINFFNNKTLNNFYFKESINKICLPKVLLKFHLYHPFLRPNNIYIFQKKCYYFLIMEMFSAIERKIYEDLSEAILAKNEISFGQTENYLYIIVKCFSDQAYKISERIKNIIYNVNWKEKDFFTNNIFYKNETFDEYFIYDRNDIIEISRFYFKSQLKNNKTLFNKYEFFPDDFEQNYYNQCLNFVQDNIIIKDLSSFVIEGYIYGFFNQTEAENLSKLFNINNTKKIEELLDKVNININSSSEYITNIKNINELKKDINITINPKVYNKSEDGNIGVRYIAFKESPLNISIFQKIVNNYKKDENSLLISNDIIIYGNQFFELIFASGNNTEKIPNDSLVSKVWENNFKDIFEKLNIEVDNIGTRYYYLIKNYIDLLNKEQASLFERGINEIDLFDQKDTGLDPKNIIHEYEEQYKNKGINEGELDDKYKNYNEKIKSAKKINIFTTDI